MLEAIPKLGLSGGVGALIGMIAVWWVEPTTSEGATLLLAVTIISSGVIGGIVSYLLGSKKETSARIEERDRGGNGAKPGAEQTGRRGSRRCAQAPA